MKASLAVRALGNAVANRQRAGAEVAGCLVHSDRGSQFRSKKFLRARRKQKELGRLTPVAFEEALQEQAVALAA